MSEGINTDSIHLDALFKYATMGIMISNSDGRIVAANPFALKLFGYTERELTGRKVEHLMPERFRKAHAYYHQDYMAEIQARPMGLGMDLVGLRKDGAEFPVEISLSSYFGDGEKYIISFINDISVRKKVEEKIEKLNNELEHIVGQRTKDLRETVQKMTEIQAFQKTLLDHAGAMIVATDADGIIKLFNPEASLNLGYQESEVIDKCTPVIFHDQEDIARKRRELQVDLDIHVADDFGVLIEKARRTAHDEERYRYIRKDGSSFPVSLTTTAIRGTGGEIMGFMGIAIDISERIKAEEELRNTLEKERELSMLKTRFVSMASHEFRTPLSTILSSAYLTERYSSAEDQPKREKHLKRIHSSVKMLTDILNDFLNVGKIEEGMIEVRRDDFIIADLMKAIIAEIKDSLKAQQHINYQHKGDPGILMDASLLWRIVINMVSNAIKFSPEGSTIELSTVNTPEYFTLSVKDQGMGISEEDQRHLAERFFRGSNAANIQGTGLGLHIISKYADLMKGKMECISELGKGSEFRITFKRFQ